MNRVFALPFFSSAVAVRPPRCPSVVARRGLLLPLLLLLASVLRASEVIPPAPQNHFNDYANIVRPETVRTLNRELEQFERESSNQILVVIYPRMQSDSSIEDYTVRVAQAWRVGQKARQNGAVLFVFAQNRSLYVQVGYGLEGAIPDAIAKRIIEDDILPRFRTGAFDQGVMAGTRALMAAARGEYTGTGRTTADGRASEGDIPLPALVFIGIIILIAILRRAMGANTVYSRGGRRAMWMGPGPIGRRGGGFGGGRGGGTFMGGGGGFGGGGAGGRW